jgi:hypothetical protein
MAILPPRGYFPQDFSPVEPRRLEAGETARLAGDFITAVAAWLSFSKRHSVGSRDPGLEVGVFVSSIMLKGTVCENQLRFKCTVGSAAGML